MLQSIRDRTHGWIAGAIVSLLILSFALWGIHSYFEGNAASNIVAKVNGIEITKPEVSVTYERLRRQLQMQYNSTSPLPIEAESSLKQRALQTLITMQVLRQASLDQGYRISSRQVDALLESMPDLKDNGQFSLVRFQQFLSNSMYSPNDFIELIKTSLLIDQPRWGMILSSFALPNEISIAASLVNQERQIEFTVLNIKDFLNRPISISAQSISAYYQTHENEFKTPEIVSIEYIELSLKNLMSAITPSEADLRKFYNENRSSFAKPAQWKLQAILIPLTQTASESDTKKSQAIATEIKDKLNKGDKFETFMKEYPAAALTQKWQDWVTLNQVPDELQKSLTALSAGQVSEPVHTSLGFVLLKVVDTQAAKDEPFENVVNKVKELVTRQQADEQYSNLKEKLSSLSYEHPDSLQTVSEALKLPIQFSGSFAKDKGGKDISANQKVREAAFTNDVLTLKNNSDVINLGNDSVVVLRIKTHEPASLLSLDAVSNQITVKLKAIEANKIAAGVAEEINQKLAKGASLDDIAKEYHLAWVNKGYLARHVTHVDSAILDEVFAMPKPMDNHFSFSSVKLPEGYAIVALTGVREGSFTKDQYDVFEEQMQSSYGLLEYELYKDSYVKQADISTESQ